MADPTATPLPADGDNVAQLLDQAVHQATLDPELSGRIQQTFGAWQSTADAVAISALLPLGLTLLILHELGTAALEGRPFRAHTVLVRTGIIVGLLLGYGRVVGLITGVAGGGAFPTSEDFLGWTGKGLKKALGAWEAELSVASAAELLTRLVIWALLVCCSLFAYVCSLLLSLSQGVLIAILVALGKSCIAVSIVPGVGLGKSWARMLAMVASWSLIAGVIASLMKIKQHDILIGLTNGWWRQLLIIGGKYVVMAFALASTPFIASALFSGAIGMAPGVMTILGRASQGAARVRGMAAGAAAAGAGYLAGRRSGNDGSFGPGPGARAHKVDRPPIAAGPRQTPGEAKHAGAAARANAAPRDIATPDRSPPEPPAVAIPGGRPGADAWQGSELVSQDRRDAYAAQGQARLPHLEAPPPQGAALADRARSQQATLRAAYPDQPWKPGRLSPRERAVVAELDAPHGRFAGWERGAQGQGDFAEARANADRRVQAATLGQARPGQPYQAGAEPAHGGARSPAAAPAGAPAAPAPAAAGAAPRRELTAAPPAAPAAARIPVRHIAADAAAQAAPGGARPHPRLVDAAPRDDASAVRPVAGAGEPAGRAGRSDHEPPPARPTHQRLHKLPQEGD